MDKSIIYFSSDEWEGSLKTSQYHIAAGLAKSYKILYVNSIGMRIPKASKGDAKKIISKLRNWLKGIQQVKKNCFVVTPIVLPFHHSKWAQKFNRLLLIYYIKLCQLKLKMKNPILITFLPNVVNIIGSFREKKVIYYCADKMSSFQGVSSRAINEMEQQLLKRADLVFATSQKLFEEKRALNPHTHYMPHGVDFHLFNKAFNGDLKPPPEIERIKQPIIGFFGLISPDWVDYQLLTHMAQLHPEWSVVLIGKVDDDIPADVLSLKNIYFLGPKKYKDLPAYLKAFKVATIPFVKSELTEYCNPIKVKEYLASGKPVVSVDLYQLSDLNHIVELTSDYQDFTNRVETILKNDSVTEMEKRINFVRNETWDVRVEKIRQLIES